MMKKAGLLAAQLVGMTVTAAAAAGLYLINKTLYRWAFWAFLPICGLFGAYLITRKGVNNYLAWFLPPVGMALGHVLVFSKLPSGAGGCLLCALTSVVGAAAGEVKNRWEAEDACRSGRKK